MPHRRIAALLAAMAALGAGWAVASPAPESTAAPAFERDARAFVTAHCVACHSGPEPKGKLDLAALSDEGKALAVPRAWRKARREVARGEMPPVGSARPPKAEIDRFVAWVDATFPEAPRPRAGSAGAAPSDPGRVTMRRLNRMEYRNTVRDLLGVDDASSDGFPSDDVGYGFDDIGDVLSMPPLLVEKYAKAAERIANEAVVVEDPERPEVRRFAAADLVSTLRGSLDHGIQNLFSNGELRGEVRLPRDGEYAVRVRAFATQAGEDPAQMLVTFDGKGVAVHDVLAPRSEPKTYEKRVRLRGGVHAFAVAFPNDFYDPKHPDPTRRDRNLYVERVEIEGPLDPMPELPAAHRRLFAPDPGADRPVAERARRVLGPLATRAWRRPVTPAEVARLSRLVEEAVADGEPFAAGVRTALEAVLTSPHFLFHVEARTRPDDPTAVEALSGPELASRISYFLWSSLPDAELFAEALRGTLPEHAGEQALRLLRDPRAGALVDGFAQQWLTLRRLATAHPDRERFPGVDARLLEDMLRETEMFFEAVMTEDRSVLDFADGRFTFVNERLARHYGLPGVAGERFRRVALDGVERAGVFTQASVLTVTSYPTRTSPVRRGKWLLEQALGDVVPPPPPGAGDLVDTPEAAHAATLRQRTERHRRDPSCAACHQRLDPLGFGLENYDAVGAWRTREGTFPVDAAGTLPDGRSFRTPAELRALIRDDPGFVRGFAEKLLTYALGRGLTDADAPAVHRIVEEAREGGYRFSRFVEAIVSSDPFTKARGDRAEGPAK